LDIKPGSYTLAVRVGSWDGRLLELAHCDDPDLAADRGLYKLGPIRISAGPVKMN